MRASWHYLWALLGGLWVRPGLDLPLLTAAAVFLVLLAGDQAARAVARRRWSPARARWVLVPLGILVVALAVRADYYGNYAPLDLGWLALLGIAVVTALPRPEPPVVAAVFGLYLWWRGLADGQSKVSREDVERAFQTGVLGIVSFVVVTLAAVPGRWERLQADAGVCVVVFLGSGLIALSLARLQAIRERSRNYGEATLRLNEQWLGLVLGVVATLLLSALLLARAMSFDLITAVATPLLSPLGHLAWLLFEAIAILAGLILVPVYHLFRWLMHSSEPFAPQGPDWSVVEQLRRQGLQAPLRPEIELLAKGVAISALVGLAMLALAWAASRRRLWSSDVEIDEEHEWVWDWRTAAVALVARLRGLRLRARRPGGPTVPGVAAGPDANRATELTIRRIYWLLLLLGSRLGVERPPAATPYEHLPRLLGSLGPAEDVTHITEAYVRARYGREQPTDDETGRVRERWQRVLAQTDGNEAPPPDGRR